MRPWLLLLALAGCSNGPDAHDAGQSGCFTGNATTAPELVIVHQDVAHHLVVTERDGIVPLIQPPQGGKVAFIGALARNLDGCPIDITAALIDDCTNETLAVERRTILMKPNADGWLEPDQPMEISSYSNLPICPNAGARRELEGEHYKISVSLKDRAGRRVEAMVRVKTECAEAEHRDVCLCECDRDYVLGMSCAADTSTRSTSCL